MSHQSFYDICGMIAAASALSAFVAFCFMLVRLFITYKIR
jgi:hypothetical protein